MYVRPDGPPASFFTLSPGDLAETLDDAYAAVAARVNASEHSVAAWKMGGSTASTRDVFDVKTPYFGPLYDFEVFVGQARVALTLAEAKAEPEIAVRVDATGADVDAWAIAVELPSSPIENLLDLGVKALIADRCAAGALVVGQPCPIADIPKDRLKVQLLDGNAVLTKGYMATLLEDPVSLARECLMELKKHGFRSAPGQWIATGGLGPCVPVSRASHLKLVSPSGSISFTLDLRTPL